MRKAMRITLVALLVLAAGLEAQSGRDRSWVAGPSYDDAELTVDLPASEHIKNIGSHRDGAGMCVFSSIEMAALAQGLESMRGWRDWCAEHYPGGGYPEKVDRCLADWFKAKNMEPLPYLQYEGQAPEPVLECIDRTGRMACLTYGWSPRYGSRIAHMVCSPLYGTRYAAVLDNNFPGDDQYEWMLKEELVRRTTIGSGSAWIFVWLAPAPPAPPRAK